MYSVRDIVNYINTNSKATFIYDHITMLEYMAQELDTMRNYLNTNQPPIDTIKLLLGRISGDSLTLCCEYIESKEPIYDMNCLRSIAAHTHLAMIRGNSEELMTCMILAEKHISDNGKYRLYDFHEMIRPRSTLRNEGYIHQKYESFKQDIQIAKQFIQDNIENFDNIGTIPCFYLQNNHMSEMNGLSYRDLNEYVSKHWPHMSSFTVDYLSTANISSEHIKMLISMPLANVEDSIIQNTLYCMRMLHNGNIENTLNELIKLSLTNIHLDDMITKIFLFALFHCSYEMAEAFYCSVSHVNTPNFIQLLTSHGDKLRSIIKKRYPYSKAYFTDNGLIIPGVNSNDPVIADMDITHW
jgi:hypothetical protein